MRPILPHLSRSRGPEQALANRYIIALAVTLATTLELLDVTVVGVAVPNMMGTLGATLDEIAWVTVGYAIANAIVLPISSWLGDLFGRRNYFLLSIVVFVASSMLCGTASTIEELVFWRIVQGFAGGGLLPIAQLILMETFPAAELGTGLAIWGAGVMLGPAIGPLLGGWLTDNFSWPWIFYINLPLGALALLLALIYVPEARTANKPDRIDGLGLLLLVVTIGCAQALLERGERLAWFESREIKAYAVLSSLGLMTFIWHELRCPHPIIDLRVFRNRQFISSLPIGMAVGGMMYMVNFAFPVYLQSLLGYTAFQAGWAQMPFVVSMTLMFMLIGRLSSLPWLDMRYVVGVGLLLAVASLWLSARLTLQSGPDDFMPMLVLRGIGVAMVFLPLTTLAVATLSAGQLGVGNSLFNLGRQFGGTMGIALFTTLFEKMQHLNRGELAHHVSEFSALTTDRLGQLQHLLASRGTLDSLAPSAALRLLDLEVGRQAAMSAFNQVYAIFALGVLITFLAIPIMARVRSSGEAAVAMH